jgi:hypothetical protein
MENGSVDVFWPMTRPCNKEPGVTGWGCKKTILRKRQPQALSKLFRILPQNHPHRKNDQVKRFFHNLVFLRVDEPHPHVFRDRGMVDLGGQTTNKPYSLILPAGVEKLLEGGTGRLDVHIEERCRDLGIRVADRLDQAKCIGTTDLGTIQISNGLIPAPHALKEGDLGRWPVEGRESVPRNRNISSRSRAVITFL